MTEACTKLVTVAITDILCNQVLPLSKVNSIFVDRLDANDKRRVHNNSGNWGKQHTGNNWKQELNLKPGDLVGSRDVRWTGC